MSHTPGFVLSVTPYKVRDQIATLFTYTYGRVNIISKRRAKYLPVLSPLMEAEFLLEERKGELKNCLEHSHHNLHLELRNSLPLLETALFFLDLIKKSQFPEKPAPLLYSLLKSYLQHLPQAENLPLFKASFLLKLLKHEGTLPLANQCMACKSPLSDGYVSLEGSFCPEHAIGRGQDFSPGEFSLLHTLAHERQLKRLLTLPPSAENDQAFKKVDALFSASLGTGMNKL